MIFGDHRTKGAIATPADADIAARRVDTLGTVATRAPDGVPILECRGVEVAYDGVQVLFGVDMEVAEGEIVALLGTNGAGKSTLLKAISGLVDPMAGTIRFAGQDITHADAVETTKLGIIQVPGGKAIFPTLTVEEHFKLANWLTNGESPDAYDARLSEVLVRFPRLVERFEQMAGNLSGGEQQQLALALAGSPAYASSGSTAAGGSPRSGWWSESPLPLATLSPTPSSDLQVTYSGTSTLAFAAVRYVVPLGSGSQKIDPSSITAVLTLSMPSPGAVGTPLIDACPTTTSWSPGGDQPASKAPKYSCADGQASAGIYDSSSDTMTWSLAAAQESPRDPGVFSVALVPAPGASAPFSAEFNTPSASNLAVLSENPYPPSSAGGGSGASANPGQGTPSGSNPASGTGSTTSQTPGSGGGTAYVPAGSSESVFNPPPFSAPTSLSAQAPAASAPTSPTAGNQGSRAGTPESSAPFGSAPRLALGAPAAAKGGVTSSTQRTIGLVVLIAVPPKCHLVTRGTWYSRCTALD